VGRCLVSGLLPESTWSEGAHEMAYVVEEAVVHYAVMLAMRSGQTVL
jgi:hypothetical protein